MNRARETWGELDRHLRLPAGEARRDLGLRLMEQLRYFGRRADALPEWKEAASVASVEDLWKIWPTLPILGKHDLNHRFPANEIGARFQIAGQINSTGGSTGEPTHFLMDEEMRRVRFCGDVYGYRQMGWTPGLALVFVWGSDRDIGKLANPAVALRAALANRFMVDGYELSDATLDRVLAILARERRAALVGFSSMLESVARRALKRGVSLPPGTIRAAWNGGEMLFDNQVELFERAFGVPLLNLYGGRELSTITYQRELGGPLWVMRPHLFLEIVDQNGAPAAPGASGRILLTSTVSRGTPFLRYEVGDLGASHPDHHDESGIRALSQLQGRTAGLLHLPNGMEVNNIFWNHLFKEFDEVEQFQIALLGGVRIELRLRGGGLTPQRDKELRDVLTRFLAGVPFELRWVDQIPVSGSGKLLQVVKE